jgi:hypothetical protein
MTTHKAQQRRRIRRVRQEVTSHAVTEKPLHPRAVHAPWKILSDIVRTDVRTMLSGWAK